jgi:glycosyltransferase involved in cell wall biosynthesis
MAIVFWIFSYNRAEFLKNCVASIELCAPGCAIHIFDDNSSDPQTRSLLAQYAGKHLLHVPQPQQDDGNKHGGLYANMQAAYELCDASDLVCFLQDDTQLVRPITPEEITRLETYCAEQGPGFIQAAFMRGCNRKKDQCRTRFDAVKQVYFVDRLSRSAGAFYSDICVFRTQQMRDAGWRFVSRESSNEGAARNTLQQMAYWRDPFVVWLPNVPAFRGKQQTWALRWAQKKRRCGFYPVTMLNADETRKFLARDPARLPYAEDFLQASEALPKPWIYYPLQGKSWLKHLNNLEIKLRRWLRL